MPSRSRRPARPGTRAIHVAAGEGTRSRSALVLGWITVVGSIVGTRQDLAEVFTMHAASG